MNTDVASVVTDFFARYRSFTFRPNEILIKAGDEPTGIFLLTGGTVKQYAITTNGDEVVVNIYKPGSFFPMSWAVSENSNNYYFEATDNVQVRRAPKDEVIAFVQNNPIVLYDLLKRVYIGTEGLLSRMVHLMSGSAYSVLLVELLIVSKRFGSRTGNSVTFPITELDLAAQTGISRETISRKMKTLKDKNLVDFSKNTLTVHDIDRLETELATCL